MNAVGGTDLSAGQDMSLSGKNVAIDSGKVQIDGKFETRIAQDALTLRVGGSVVNAIQSVQSVQQATQATDNKRMQAMAAATAALAAKMCCFNRLSERVMARDFARQVVELQVRAAILTRLGKPMTVADTMP